MKRTIQSILFCCCVFASAAQITTPIVRANFEVDGGLRSNIFNGIWNTGGDDWFGNGEPGTGVFVIDTTGASYINQLYLNNPASRRYPLFRSMNYPQFSVVNNMMLIDAVFIRDHHGADSTAFASGSNKNSQSPATWATPTVQGVPDKSDILDMFMHVRRAGPFTTDSLWLFGGVSLEGSGGNRYFDFEMYQTDIVYERSSLKFKGYGPDAGHTSWTFDATGKVVTAGDVIFTAEYSGSGLQNLEARIWVNKSALTTVTPAAFSWGGAFDGATAGSTFGYANILPTSAGAFYTGLQCGANTWAGPFGLVRGDNSFVPDYEQDQFLEFSVNLSKLGVDPLVSMGDACKMPFRRILVKSRSSSSFSAELKDFVGPFDFFRAAMATAAADIPMFCGSAGISTLSVSNPLITSLYTWKTPDGHIAGGSIGPTIMVDQPGTYIVSQELMDSCGSTYATDTVLVTLDPFCTLLQQTDKNRKFVFEKNLLKRAVSILPNPVGSHLRLSLASPVKEAASISIVDITGRELYRVRTDAIKTAALIDIPCPVNWRNGAYFVRVVMGNETITKKMILAR
ncbi:T9SS type A sorting domain-containing protein [Paraflavitalea sp. CAU 1676]|uniref:T9SS type A sorting domain-containing protein n=1 Tax=Paraflavitalea sp. CAU 1676 TaxID=3032598 RepID=UPI0023DAFCA4|nr:T9SS type A sorting domain-containing protein [Paraflavitalea sp. CAU 1676]MDF2191602.1 T9SS type A sorting domain-containing protein [Paraflavitalea sp. CAU 1676]